MLEITLKQKEATSEGFPVKLHWLRLKLPKEISYPRSLLNPNSNLKEEIEKYPKLREHFEILGQLQEFRKKTPCSCELCFVTDKFKNNHLEILLRNGRNVQNEIFLKFFRQIGCNI